MAKKRKKRSKAISFKESLQEETLEIISAIIFFVVAILLVLAAFGSAGVVGTSVYNGLTFLFGVGYFLLPVLLVFLSISFVGNLREKLGGARIFGSILFFASGLGFLDLIFEDRGGIIGQYVSNPLVALFDFWATALLLLALIAVSVLIILDFRPRFSGIFSFLKRDDTKYDDEDSYEDDEGAEESLDAARDDSAESDEEYEDVKDTDEGSEEEEEEEMDEPKGFFGRKKGRSESVGFRITGNVYNPPPLSLLNKDKGKPDVGDIKANANIIKRTLENFGIDIEMDEVSIGPSVTRYSLKPAEGVRLSKIIGLQNNLELALAAHPVRIEAPIPGRALVGIEIPNNAKTTIGLGTILANDFFQDSLKPLLIVLGKDITGLAHFADLAKMPHLLIAGATGAGKSVTIHAMITSLLLKSSPELLRFIMIDPKRVELTLYNNIPHLLTPVITDAKKSILALKWAAKEMERRYDILEAEGVRDVVSYHKNVLGPALKKAIKKNQEAPEAMPYIVIIIDELADIMSAYPRELESAVIRLAQMSRAVGIHLILSTQRPSVDVITGLIKANIPARVALQVASQIDSRTILDGSGAEKLLGAGDMLYLSGEMSKPRRIQAPFVSEEEVKRVVSYLKKHFEDELPLSIDLTTDKVSNSLFESDLGDDEEDELYEEAREVVIEAGKASTSYLQRKLRIGYSRAARLMDMLEERGVIGPADGSRAREILKEESDYVKDTDVEDTDVEDESLDAARDDSVESEDEDEEEEGKEKP
ncbi:DNA translocase FtsK [Patescibacteria group bacterium]|nr:DNA translocase FtsK [Patescibacteria group bacterium]